MEVRVSTPTNARNRAGRRVLTTCVLAAWTVVVAPAVTGSQSGTQTPAQATASQARRATSAAPKDHPAKQYTIEQFLATESVSGAIFSADEKRLLYTSNRSGVPNVYGVPVSGGASAALTTSNESTYVVAQFPRDDRFLYTRDRGGNELNHVFVRLIDGREVDLTPGDRSRASFMGWNRDRTAFYVQINERDNRFFDVYRYDADTYTRAVVFRNEGGYIPAAVSGDERWVALAKPNTANDRDIYLWNVQSSALTHITPHGGRAVHTVAEFDPASTWLYYLTDQDSEFVRVRRYELTTGKHEDVEGAEWDVLFTGFSAKGTYRVTAINRDGSTVVKMLETATGREVPLPVLPAGEVTSVRISPSEKYVALQASGDRAPANLYVWQVGAKSATRLTDTLSREVDPDDLVDAEVVRFTSFDGLVVPNILWKPHQATADAKAPALVWVHGGPGGQTRVGYSPLIQFLVNHGYVVLGINNRGSSGYGKTFLASDDKKHGREPLWDCVEAKRYLASLPYVDASRVGIIGGSYGGYMVLAALAFRPAVFDVGVDIFGVSNWLRTLRSMPAWWEAQRQALYDEMGDPERDIELLRAASPLFHADKIRRPLLVLQGANDPRVLKAESDEIVAAVKRNGVPVEYLVFPDEGHGFTKKKNQVAGYGAVLKFLDAHLRDKGSPGGP